LPVCGESLKGLQYHVKMHEDGREYGKYKVKPNSQIDVEDLRCALEGKPLSDGHIPKWIYPVRDKSYVVITYHLGSRKMEATKVQKEDMVFTKDFLFIKIPAFKHGERADVLKLKMANVGMEFVKQQWERTRKAKRVWELSDSTAYRIVVRALGKCPHWLRHNWITTKQQQLPGQPSEVDRKIQSWTGIKHRETLDNYRMKMKKDIEEIAELEG